MPGWLRYRSAIERSLSAFFFFGGAAVTGRSASSSGHVPKHIEKPRSTPSCPRLTLRGGSSGLRHLSFATHSPYKLALCTAKRPANSPAYCSTNQSLRPLNCLRRPTWPRLNRFSLHPPLWHQIPFSLTLDSSDSDNQ